MLHLLVKLMMVYQHWSFVLMVITVIVKKVMMNQLCLMPIAID
jgi:hypothetical protein